MDISLTQIDSFYQDFNAEPKRKLSQNAISQVDVIDLIMDRERYQSISHTYSHSVDEEGTPVTNQKSSGRCWLFAALNTARIPFMKERGIKEFEFSQSYLFFWDKLEKSNYFLNSIIQTRNEDVHSRVVMWLLSDLISDGGQWDMIVNLVEKYGVVPKEVYPESHASSSSRRMNWLLKHKLREFAMELRADPNKSEEELFELKEHQMNVIFRILCIFLGTPPKQFNWSYRNKDKEFLAYNDYTPLRFYEELVKPVFDVNDMVCLINAPTTDKPYNRLFTVEHLGNIVGGHPIRYINLTIEELKQYASAQIEDGSPVWFGCDVGKWFNMNVGVLDQQLLDYPLAFDTTFGMNKAQRLDYGESQMTHAMVFTAFDKSEDGKINKWRVENSWGSEKGHKGYLLMTDDWFTEFTYEIVVHKKYVPESVLEILSQEPIVLNPWDPMGSLAMADE
eukprot:TRINITY_DN7981_c0_g1_i1.p1 TRINITY_DN7981_c0_g1~~TRINITY_DN7981_c0_g1_i1.p1  ORF type:complete len:459 (-),score=103.39 TRINITY_DN7981_c0_g1_i1:11-1357(-)